MVEHDAYLVPVELTAGALTFRDRAVAEDFAHPVRGRDGQTEAIRILYLPHAASGTFGVVDRLAATHPIKKAVLFEPGEIFDDGSACA